MPTNTTTNTNTTPLSAMTGEEVASILVGLIRQNDGVLIQQKVTDGINQSNMNTVIANEYTNGKQAIVTALASVGISATMSDSLQQLAQKMLQAVAIVNTATFTSGTTMPITLSKIINDNAIVSIVDSTIITLSSYLKDIKYLSLPNVVSGNFGRTINCYGLKVASYTGSVNNIVGTSYSNPGYMPNIRHLHGCTSYSTGDGYSTGANLYDFILYNVELRSTNTNLNQWRPSTALSNTSGTLVQKDEWDDANEPVGVFDNNLQKFLWYFEYHFIPCFGTVTTSPVLSLYTTVYNAINSATSISDPTKTLKQLLTDKGWEVASVS